MTNTPADLHQHLYASPPRACHSVRAWERFHAPWPSCGNKRQHLPASFPTAYLDRHLELLPGDELLELVHQLPRDLPFGVFVHYGSQRRGNVAVQRDVQLH